MFLLEVCHVYVCIQFFLIPQVCRVSQKVKAGHNYLATSGIFGGLTPGPSVGKSDA